jgi:predicted glycoside hydrolase/deacetylase ChbG (UPF0249 family)
MWGSAEGERYILNVGPIQLAAGLGMKVGERQPVLQAPFFLRAYLLQSFHTDSHQHLSKELPGLQPWAGAASLAPSLILRLPSSWTEQQLGSLPLQCADSHCGPTQPPVI